MTARQKAVELVAKYYPLARVAIKWENAKQCALIAVDEILSEFPQGYNGNFEEKRKAYWQQVKEEIQKL